MDSIRVGRQSEVGILNFCMSGMFQDTQAKEKDSLSARLED